MREVKFSEVLKQYKIYHLVEDDTEYRQVTISIHSGVSFRGTKFGRDIGRKRQFVIDLEKYPNSFIFTRQGVQNGSYGIAPKEVNGCVVTENMPMFSIEPILDPEYLEYYLQTDHFQDQLQALNASGSAQKSIHEKILLQLNILLPDTEEQKAIVDEIKSVEKKQARVLDELKIQSELISKLRSSILSDAVSGKLVSQDSNDESAKVLLEKIKAEKDKLIKEGDIKIQKLLPPINKVEIPYELPNGWVWCRLADAVDVRDGTHDTPAYVSEKEGIPLITSKNFVNGNIDFNSAKFISLSDHNAIKIRSCVEVDDILFSMIGGNIGNMVKISTDREFSIKNVALFKYYNKQLSISDYLFIYLKQLAYYIQEKSVGGAQPFVSLSYLRSLLYPLPPLEEQKRIVEKVEKLMATCNALELEVQNSKIETEKLMQSILKEAFLVLDTLNDQPKASKAFQRSVLAAYIVDNSLEDKHFGHVKLQKMLFMCEVANNLDFDSHYKRHAMGPYDPKLLRSVDLQLKRNKWFGCEKMDGDKGRYIYSPLEKSDEYKKYLNRYFKFENIEKMFFLMKPMTTLQAEIVATLYSVYKDLKSMQQKISSQILINEARNNWHDRKKTIEIEKWERAIEWMKEKQLISYE